MNGGGNSTLDITPTTYYHIRSTYYDTMGDGDDGTGTEEDEAEAGRSS